MTLGSPDNPYKHYGLETGVIINDVDPSGLNRVRVQVPGILVPGVWAEVLMLGSPRSRGDVAIPTIGSNVLVGFRSGELEDPIVMGGFEPPIVEGGIRASIPEEDRQKFRFVENEDWVFVLGATGTDFPYAAMMSRATGEDGIERIYVILDGEARTIKIKAPLGVELYTDGVLQLNGKIVRINDRVVSKNSQPI